MSDSEILPFRLIDLPTGVGGLHREGFSFEGPLVIMRKQNSAQVGRFSTIILAKISKNRRGAMDGPKSPSYNSHGAEGENRRKSGSSSSLQMGESGEQL